MKCETNERGRESEQSKEMAKAQEISTALFKLLESNPYTTIKRCRYLYLTPFPYAKSREYASMWVGQRK